MAYAWLYQTTLRGRVQWHAFEATASVTLTADAREAAVCVVALCVAVTQSGNGTFVDV